MFTTTLLASKLSTLALLIPTGTPQSAVPPAPLGGWTTVLSFIQNQMASLQDPGVFRIGKTISNGQQIGEIAFRQANDSDAITGLKVASDTTMTNKGAMTGVRATTSMNNYAAQAGTADASLSVVSGFFAAGSVRGINASATPSSFTNFGSSNVSVGVGGQLSGGPTPIASGGAALSLDGTGNYFIGGVYGELHGTVNGAINTEVAGQGAVAAVIGVDNMEAGSTVTSHWAGYFDGDVFATGNFYIPSSERWKTNVQVLPNALDTIDALRGVSYTRIATGKTEVGVIAEEVAKVLPELVKFESDGHTPAGVDYSRLSAVLIQAVKEQEQHIASLEARLAALEYAERK